MRKTRQIQVGNVKIGGGAPVSIQSMTNTDTADSVATLHQIDQLAAAGCQIVRCAVQNHASLESFGEICRLSPIPVVADIHFDHTLAIGALERGAACVRVNPGNLPSENAAREVARKAAQMGRPVRIGVNLGSLSKEAESRYGRTPEAMVESALQYARLFEEEGCLSLKASLKASDVRTTVTACRMFAERTDIPLHLGITEAGPVSCGIVKSAVGIGALLLEGIGDTIRVSLTAPPVEEIKVALRILEATGLRKAEPEIISCPTCARTRIDLMELVSAVEKAIDELKASGHKFKVGSIAVMGCEVNGPGEASNADIGIAGAANKQGILFRKGRKIATLGAGELLPALLKEL